MKKNILVEWLIGILLLLVMYELSPKIGISLNLPTMIIVYTLLFLLIKA